MGELRRLGYRPALNGVRAVAILSVLGFHAIGRPSGGFLGVHIFFVLSGFLITTLLLEEWDARGTISLKHFYLRRALRLLPALVVALVGFAIVTGVLLALGRHPDGLTAGTAARGALVGLFYVSNIVQAAGMRVPGSIGHLWSLATEEQFYLLWPVTLVVGLRSGLSRRAIGFGLCGLIVVIAAHRLEMTVRDLPLSRIYVGPDGSFDLLLVGCLAGVIFTNPQATPVAARVCRFLWLPAAAGIATALLAMQIGDRSLYAWILLAFAIAVALLLLHVVVDERSLLARVLGLRPLVYIGRISYGIYLWHQILGALPGVNNSYAAGWGRLAALTASSVAAASISYYLVERPFLRRKQWDREQLFTAPPTVPGLAAT